MTDVFVNGQRLRLSAGRIIGQGGEAEIYDIGTGQALKLYKPPTHPDYKGLPNEQEGARRRIETIQTKLRDFPKGLPDRIVAPTALATDKLGSRVLGYTMPLLTGAEVLMRYSERKYREQGGISNRAISEIFTDLHQTVRGTHAKGVVFGDFNDLNVLIRNNEAHVVDIDSCQFGGFLTPMFTARFVDPFRCDPNASSLHLVRPHNTDSDWYAFAVMLMQSLLYVDPYGGVYRPADPRKRVNHNVRPLHRITVFNPEVKYPRAAIPYSVLPDELLEYFHEVFEKDVRGEFPADLLMLPWVKCPACGMEHARRTCPNCAFTVQVAPEKKKVRGKVTASTIFSTQGIILFAAYQNGKIAYLYHESGRYMREGDRVVADGRLDAQSRFRIQGDDTLIGRRGALRILSPSRQEDVVSVDSYGTLPVFDANFRSVFWTETDTLVRQGRFGPEKIGNVLSGQTLFWVGPSFGFGFARAGTVSLAFVFDAGSNAINDDVKLPPISGQLIDSTAVFAQEVCWFLVSVREGGRSINRCYMIGRDGTVKATAEAEADDGSWLGTLRGKTAAGNFLFAPTDEGIVRVEAQGTKLSVTREFPDTEPFVDSTSQLFAASDGIYVVNRKEVIHISIG